MSQGVLKVIICSEPGKRSLTSRSSAVHPSSITSCRFQRAYILNPVRTHKIRQPRKACVLALSGESSEPRSRSSWKLVLLAFLAYERYIEFLPLPKPHSIWTFTISVPRVQLEELRQTISKEAARLGMASDR
ncbi:hypothetical protein BDV24DRAFT_129377 [Aspergillus arachidicola]|uniref:Uncharacterized protein n=1 Tax=Aspergillus arachidicola TaxID=656916 RepID=A0A5N6YI10_9EURO|nr:hypothetical protein BDV24DRAFT_129377 [Aspergillus arachidicola]